MKKPTDNRLCIIDATGLAVCLAITAAMFFAAVRPVLDEHVKQREQQARLDELNLEADNMALSLAQMRQLFMETQQAVADRPLQLKAMNHLNQRLAQVTALAEACQLSLNRIEPGKHIAQSRYVTVPIHIIGQGGYAAAVRFLDRLHQDWPDLAVASLSLTGNPRTRGSKPAFIFELLWFAAPNL